MLRVGRLNVSATIFMTAIFLVTITHGMDDPRFPHITPNRRLIAAAFWGNVVAAEHAIAAGADVNQHDRAMIFPLHYAALRGFDLIIELLLNTGADSNARDPGLRTALHIAARAGHRKIIQSLLENGAHRDARDYRGETPLFYAIRAGYFDIVELLLKNGADITVMNASGYLASDIASVQNRIDIITILERAAASSENRSRSIISVSQLPTIYESQEFEIGEVPLR